MGKTESTDITKMLIDNGESEPWFTDLKRYVPSSKSREICEL